MVRLYFFRCLCLLGWLLLAFPARSQEYRVPTGGAATVTVSGGWLYDNGGPFADFHREEASGSIILRPAVAGQRVALRFAEFDIVPSVDNLYIYDGDSPSAPLLGQYSATGPIYVAASPANPTGALTVALNNSNLGIWALSFRAGFAAEIQLLATPELPNLTLTSVVGTPTTLVAGQRIIASCTLQNPSNTRAVAATLTGYWSTDAVLDAGDVALTSVSTPSLPVGANVSFYPNNFYFNVPATAPVGDYYLLLKVDAANTQAETNELDNVAALPVFVRGPYYDVVARPALLRTRRPAPGDLVPATGYAYNGGTDPNTRNSTQAVYLSTDSVRSANDLLLATGSNSGASVGFQATQSFNLRIPTTTALGTYYLLFVVDSQNSINEVNENNNVRPEPIDVIAPAVDLLVTRAQLARPTLMPGQTVRLSNVLRNAGSESLNAPGVDFFLSRDTQWDAADTRLAGRTILGILGAGMQDSANTTLTIPAATTLGAYYVLAVADPAGTVTETNEQNNVRSTALTVIAAAPDFVLTRAALSTSQAAPGDRLGVLSYHNNLGTTAGGGTSTTCYLSTDGQLDATDVSLGSEYDYFSPQIDAGTSIMLTLPATTAPGNYQVLFVADAPNTVAESDETNNLLAVPLTVLSAARPDLTVPRPLLESREAVAGTGQWGRATVFNQGNARATSSPLGVYLSTDSLFSATDVALLQSTGRALASNVGLEQSLRFTIPAGTAPGRYYVLFVADPLSAVAEADEQNNVAARPLQVGAAATGSLLPATGRSAVLLAQGPVYDNGGGAGNYGATDDGGLTIQPSLENGRVQLQFSSFSLGSASWLAVYDGPDESWPLLGYFRTQPATLTANNAAGVLTLVLHGGGTAGAGFVAQATSVPGSIAPTPGLDLIVDEPSIGPVSVTAGQPLTFRYTVRSIGGLTYSIFTDYYISRDPLVDEYDRWLGGTTAGGSSASPTNVDGELTIPADLAAGEYYMVFRTRVSTSSSVREEDSRNNIGCARFRVQGGQPDLLITQLRPGAAVAITNQTLRLNWSVRNNGQALASACQAGFYLSTDAQLDAADQLLSTVPLNMLPPGQEANRSAALFIPASVAPGSYYLLAVADAAQQLPESNEQNNVLVAPLQITIATAVRAETNLNSQLQLYPNPATDGAVQWELQRPGRPEPVELTLLNSQGQRLWQRSTAAPTGRISTSGLPTGVYLLHAQGTGWHLSCRLVVR